MKEFETLNDFREALINGYNIIGDEFIILSKPYSFRFKVYEYERNWLEFYLYNITTEEYEHVYGCDSKVSKIIRHINIIMDNNSRNNKIYVTKEKK